MAEANPIAPVNEDVELLICQICKNQQTDPHFLSTCLHSFCKKCISSVPKTTKDDMEGWVCPQCHSFTQESGLEISELLVSLLKLKNGEATDYTCL